jgi:ABC-type lipopolysaccharide export system ATPase subunit
VGISCLTRFHLNAVTTVSLGLVEGPVRALEEGFEVSLAGHARCDADADGEGNGAAGRALMSEPQLLMLDEPSLGLAPAGVEALYDKLEELHRAGLTLLLAEQSIPLALAIADYAHVLQTGRVALDGTAADLADNDQVREIYLGFGAGVTT